MTIWTTLWTSPYISIPIMGVMTFPETVTFFIFLVGFIWTLAASITLLILSQLIDEKNNFN